MVMESQDTGNKTSKGLLPTRVVYSYYFPEVRQTISEITEVYPHEVFLRSITPGLDSFHEPILDLYVDKYKSFLPGLSFFPYRYVSSGASESIFHVLAMIAGQTPHPQLYQLEGEYEGFAGYGMNLGLSFTTIAEDADFVKLKPGIWFLSNPNSKLGKILDESLLDKIGNAGHKIVLDCSYVGLTAPHTFLVNHPAVETVIISMSKPYGIYYYRVGFCFSKKEYKTLEVNKWFKNIFSLIIVKALLEKFEADYFFKKYHAFQEKAKAEIEQQLGISCMASDVMLLAIGNEVTEANKQKLAMFNRSGVYRFCLTPYLLSYETKAI